MSLPVPNKTFLLFLLSSYGVLITTLIVLSIVIPKGQDILLINQTYNDFQDRFFPVITNLGDGVIIVPIIGILLFVRFQHVLAVSTTAIVLGAITSALKRVYFLDAGRPITFVDNDLLHFVPGVKVHALHSFPSGHTATIFAIAIFLSLLSGRKGLSISLLVLAALVGYSRMYLLQHFLIDVTAGAILGTITATVVYYLFATQRSAPWMNWNLQIRIRLAPRRKVQTFRN